MRAGVVLHRRQRPNRHIGAFQRLDPTHEQQQWIVRGQTQCATRLGPVTRPEEGVIDTGCHHPNAVRVTVIELGELRRLHRARSQHDLGAAHHGGFGLGAPMGLVARHLLGARLGLHSGQGVEGRHQREVELVLDAVAGDARQPVVGVHGIEAGLVVQRRVHARTRGHEGQDVVGELVDDGGKLLFGHGAQGACRHVVDTQPRLHGHGGRQLVRPRPGIDVALDAGTSQGGGKLPNVDVHPPAVTGPGLGQRRGVQGEHRESTHRRGAYLDLRRRDPAGERPAPGPHWPRGPWSGLRTTRPPRSPPGLLPSGRLAASPGGRERQPGSRRPRRAPTNRRARAGPRSRGRTTGRSG